LALTTLALPFVWLEIGPMGKEFYGPDVPDIYILGGTILGKNNSFWGINLAYKFQLFTILFFSISCLGTVCFLEKRKLALSFTFINLLLLVLFPLWLYNYVGGVLNNSDGASADIIIHLQIGLIVFLLLFINTLFIIKRLYKNNSILNL